VDPAGVNLIGVVVALQSEARCLVQRPFHRATQASAAGLSIQVSGMGCTRAARAALHLVRQQRVSALLCFGVAGALDPSLRCGDVVLATEVICAQPLALQLAGMRPAALPAQARLRTSERWRAELAAVLRGQGSITERPILTSAQLICERQEKMQLFRQSGAVAVDMESAAVGVVASLHDLPFMVLRVIADTAEDSLPTVLRSLIGPDPMGQPSWVSWLSLLLAPGAWPGLIHMGRRYQRARETLKQCSRLAWSNAAREWYS
jgi:adenosylhomocysteine nucleosidase